MKQHTILFLILLISTAPLYSQKPNPYALDQATYLDESLAKITGVEVIRLSLIHKKVLCKIAAQAGDTQKVYDDTLLTYLEEKAFKYAGIDYYELLSRVPAVPDEVVLEMFAIIWNGQLACFECDITKDGDYMDGGILVWAMLSGHEKFIERLSHLEEYKSVNLNTVLTNGQNIADFFYSTTTDNSRYSAPRLGYAKGQFQLLESVGAKQSPKRSTYADSRDNRKYNTITFNSDLDKKNYTWIVANLDPVSATSFEVPTDGDYGDQPGRLYTYQESQEVCPMGWHLPSEADWEKLINEMGTSKYAGPVFKSYVGWNHDGYGLNEYGFNAFPSGYRTANNFEGIGDYAYFWSSTKEGESEAIAISSYAKSDKISTAKVNTSRALSVRCVKD